MILELENICKEYMQGKIPVPVLKNINFSMEEGEYVAIMGPSGSGKTTLMNIVGCLDQATSGRLILDGRNGIVDVLIFQRLCVNTAGELTNTVRQHPHIGNGLLGRYGRRTITGPRQAF